MCERDDRATSAKLCLLILIEDRRVSDTRREPHHPLADIVASILDTCPNLNKVSLLFVAQIVAQLTEGSHS
jgi:hypothetical protein